MLNFLFVAAENDAIANCKAGGMGDVVRDVPRQISQRGDHVHVVVPSYSRLHLGAEFISKLIFPLRNQLYTAEIYKIAPKKEFENITHYVIHHPEIQAGDIAHIYHNDLLEPYYTDAIKYFIFCKAVAQAMLDGIFNKLDVVHLHDWHSSPLLFIKEYEKGFNSLQSIRYVYSIHNLAIQGIRPFENNYSSVRNWFPYPSLDFNYEKLKDDRYPDCINLMAVGIRLADAVHTVSPSYKDDIRLPSRPPEFIGGEGLEKDLQQANAENRLFGILNGANYSNIRTADKNQLFPNITLAIFKWLQQESKKYKSDFLAHTGEKIMPYLAKKPDFICSSVARLTEQKFYFFKRSPEALVDILKTLDKINGVYMLLGTGAPEYEAMMRKISYDYPNFIFINAQSEDVIDSIYLESDLYFMPSLFEPCGISQMLAMRNGNPCFVHNTGGLKDTVEHMVTGFSFGGNTYDEIITSMTTEFDNVIKLFEKDKSTWKKIQKNASLKRFTWEASVDEYYKYLYKTAL
ncbi:MAG: glycogen/starch synthase [Leeuwenhoekiella sp.]